MNPLAHIMTDENETEVKKMFEVAEDITIFPQADVFKKEQKMPEEKIPGLGIKPIHLNQSGAPRLKALFYILPVLVAVVLAYFFVRELSLRRQSASQLAVAEQARAELQQAVDELRGEVDKQRTEIAKLAGDLEKAAAKAAMVDTLKSTHQEELVRLKALYESQLSSVKSVLGARDELIKSFQSNLEAIRTLLERSAGVGIVTPSAQPQSGAAASLGAPEFRTAGKGAVEGNVMMVDREHQFVVVTLGPAEGARVGRFVQIYQKGKPIGEGRIDRVYQNLSAATVLSEDALERVEKGDQVFLATA